MSEEAEKTCSIGSGENTDGRWLYQSSHNQTSTSMGSATEPVDPDAVIRECANRRRKSSETDGCQQGWERQVDLVNLFVLCARLRKKWQQQKWRAK